MNIIDKYHIVRRVLLIIFTYFFLLITYRIFCDGIELTAFKLSAYVFFGGIETFMLKFYYDSRDKEGEIK
uniref:Uncharacterized protein n=1 Tax=viral metagenome TaxID=1070528 RepID=A0A6M3L3H5_9ZZZZ